MRVMMGLMGQSVKSKEIDPFIRIRKGTRDTKNPSQLVHFPCVAKFVVPDAQYHSIKITNRRSSIKDLDLIIQETDGSESGDSGDGDESENEDGDRSDGYKNEKNE
nr:hypothetical protein [Tanacetum cinerariifolium]